MNVRLPSKTRCNDVDDVKRNWSKLSLPDILELSNKLNINWAFSKNLDDMNIEEMWDELHGKLSSISEQVPHVGPARPDRIDKYNMPWITSSFKRAVRNKNKAWAVFDTNPSTENLSIALHKQNIVDEVEHKSKIKYEKLITSNLKHNSKAFYSYLRNRRNVKSVVTVLKKDKQLGALTQSDLETADCFASAFSSVFVREPCGPLPQHCYSNCANSIGDIYISKEDVLNELKSLNIYKSFGPDNVHPKLLRAMS